MTNNIVKNNKNALCVVLKHILKNSTEHYCIKIHIMFAWIHIKDTDEMFASFDTEKTMGFSLKTHM